MSASDEAPGLPRSLPVTDAWTSLRALTPARIALGRTGAALPTAEVLRFGVAHARARDAVHQALDGGVLAAELAAAGFDGLRVQSAASDRVTYLRRPDLGRRLNPASAAALRTSAGAGCGLCIVIADGLSATAVQAHALPLLRALAGEAGGRWRPGRVVIAEQARVALGDEIGECLRARAVAVLIGERPGLSSPASLGVYLTLSPRIGRTDAERNCISNIRPEGLSGEQAARRLAWLLDAAFCLGVTGVLLKDRSDEATGHERPAGGLTD